MLERKRIEEIWIEKVTWRKGEAINFGTTENLGRKWI